MPVWAKVVFWALMMSGFDAAMFWIFGWPAEPLVIATALIWYVMGLMDK